MENKQDSRELELEHAECNNDFLKDNFIFDDEEDFNNKCEKDLYIEDENLEEDIEFIEFLRSNTEYPIVPQEIKEKIKEDYRKHFSGKKCI